MFPIFDWLGDITSGAFDGLSKGVSSMIFDMMLRWLYSIIYDAIAQFFGNMSAMASDIFSLPWVEAVVRLFYRFGWALFVVGMVVAIFDVAIEFQSGRASPKTAALNIMKGLLATAMFSIVPVELYKFCVTLQNTFLSDLGRLVAGAHSLDLGAQSVTVLEGSFKAGMDVNTTLFSTLSMIAFAYSVIKVFFCCASVGAYWYCPLGYWIREKSSWLAV